MASPICKGTKRLPSRDIVSSELRVLIAIRASPDRISATRFLSRLAVFPTQKTQETEEPLPSLTGQRRSIRKEGWSEGRLMLLAIHWTAKEKESYLSHLIGRLRIFIALWLTLLPSSSRHHKAFHVESTLAAVGIQSESSSKKTNHLSTLPADIITINKPRITTCHSEVHRASSQMRAVTGLSLECHSITWRRDGAKKNRTIHREVAVVCAL